MNTFQYELKTKTYFGKDAVKNDLPFELEKVGHTVMLAYGGGSVKKNGIYDAVTALLKKNNKTVAEISGVMPNPTVAKLHEGIEIARAHKADLLLAVGGGSVCDYSKAVSVSFHCEEEPWEKYFVRFEEPSCEIVPVGCVLTMVGTGSEMNAGAVISNLATQEKFAFHHSFPQFSILDPEATFSLPPFQVACGIADTFVHVMEQYLTVTGVSPLMDRWAEGILQTLIEIAPKIRANQHDYDQMANFMLCATMGLNGFIAMGVPQDWATHMIGHELTALHGVTHGQTLVVVLPALMSVMREQKKGKILQYGERVFGIREGSEDERIDRTIRATEEFFRSLGLATRLHELQIGQGLV